MTTPGLTSDQLVSPARCAHCGQSVDAFGTVTQGESAEVAFCCAGCRTVYYLLQEHDLSSYYSLLEKEEQLAKRAPEHVSTRYSYLDDPTFVEQNVHLLDSGGSEICFYAEGMHCSACIWLLEKLPRLDSTIVQSRVDFARSTVRVTFDSGATTPSKIAALIAKLGYPVHPYDKSSAREYREREAKHLLVKIGVAGLAAGNTMLLAVSLYQGVFTGIEEAYRSFFEWVSFVLCLPVMLYSAIPFYRGALGGLRAGKLHIDLPISIGIIAGFFLSVVNTIYTSGKGVYYDSIAMLTFLLLVGRYLQRQAIERSLQLNEARVGFLPVSANRRAKSGEIQSIFVSSIQQGDELVVAAGETVPADGTVLRGIGELDMSVLTGETLPIELKAGSSVFAGSRVVVGEIHLLVEKPFSRSRLGLLVEQMQERFTEPVGIQTIADKLGSRFVVAILSMSVINFALWYLFVGEFRAFETTLSLLIITCPCAIGLATPIISALSVSRALKRGILIQTGDSLELLPKANLFFFDKTGTITAGHPEIVECLEIHGEVTTRCSPKEVSPETQARVLALEKDSFHPIARAFQEALSDSLPEPGISRREISGKGVEGKTTSREQLLIGSLSFVRERLHSVPPTVLERIERFAGEATVVAYAEGEELRFCFRLEDSVREEAKELVRELQTQGATVLLLSGDRKQAVAKAARELGLSVDEHIYAECSPEQKAKIVQEKSSQPGMISVMVGDGANDLVALQSASVGIGLRGGVESCLGAVDVFIPQGELSSVREAIEGSKSTVRRIHRCLRGALAYNLVGGALAVSGIASPLIAAILMPVSSLSVLSYALAQRGFAEDRLR